MEIVQTILLKGVRIEKDEYIEVITKRGSKLLAKIDFNDSLEDGASIVLQGVDGLDSGWDMTTLALDDIESIRIIQPSPTPTTDRLRSEKITPLDT